MTPFEATFDRRNVSIEVDGNKENSNHNQDWVLLLFPSPCLFYRCYNLCEIYDSILFMNLPTCSFWNWLMKAQEKWHRIEARPETFSLLYDFRFLPLITSLQEVNKSGSSSSLSNPSIYVTSIRFSSLFHFYSYFLSFSYSLFVITSTFLTTCLSTWWCVRSLVQSDSKEFLINKSWRHQTHHTCSFSF